MNCQEFKNRIDELLEVKQPKSSSNDVVREHAAVCAACSEQLENERALSAGLRLLVQDEQKIEAPSYLRADLLATFESRTRAVSSNVLSFPNRSNWTRWALAAAAMLLLGFVLFAARWIPNSESNQIARSVDPATAFGPGEAGLSNESSDPEQKQDAAPEAVASRKGVAPSRYRANPASKVSPATSVGNQTQIASSEVKSEFVPLTYLNNATAMDSGIVVRVEIAREQLATLGIPFDMERADEIIKADIVVGDDGVARAIRLVQ